MNRSKLITTTALATVMSASAAHAELSLSGFYAATIADADGGTTHGTSTSSMYVTYTDTLDNGMGLTFNISASAGWHGADVFIDTGVGTLGLGDGQDSSVLSTKICVIPVDMERRENWRWIDIPEDEHMEIVATDLEEPEHVVVERKVDEAIERMSDQAQQDMFNDETMNWSGLR